MTEQSYLDSFVGETILIFLRVRDEEPVVGPLRLIPLRFSRIEKVELVGGFALFRYSLAQFFNSSEFYPRLVDDTVCQAISNSIYRNCEELVDENLLPHFFEAPYLSARTRSGGIRIFGGQLDLSLDKEAYDSWVTIVSKFYDVKELRELPFLLFCGLRRLRKRRAFSYSRLEQSQFLSFEAGTAYEIKLFEVLPHELRKLSDEEKASIKSIPDPRQYKLRLDSNFATEEGVQQAIGGYDFVEFIAPLKFDTQGASGSLKLELDKSRIKSRTFIAQYLSLEYRVRYGLYLAAAVIGLLLIVISSAVSGLHPEISSYLQSLLGITKTVADFVVRLLEATILGVGIASGMPFLIRWLR